MSNITLGDINIDDLENRFKICKLTSTTKMLIDSGNLQNLEIEEQDLIDLVAKVEYILTTNSDKKAYNELLKAHPGGKQTFVVYEAKLGKRSVAVKIYKSIINHLLVHTIASNFLANSHELKNILEEFNLPGKVYFPKTLGIKLIEGGQSKAILVQEWIDNGKDIYVKYPREHVQIIRSVTKAITKKNIIVDIMSKNWIICEQNNLHYIDLILFSPKGELISQIKKLSNQLA